MLTKDGNTIIQGISLQCSKLKSYFITTQSAPVVTKIHFFLRQSIYKWLSLKITNPPFKLNRIGEDLEETIKIIDYYSNW